MILAVDIHYSRSYAFVAGIFFQKWEDAKPLHGMTGMFTGAEPYEPGAFYRRELPPILDFLSGQKHLPDILVVDGFVHLNPPRRGLGAHLRDQTGCTVIGVAKNPLMVACSFAPVYRGKSKRPLYVSAAGMDLQRACDTIRSMHGQYRIPTLIKLADTLCRESC
jgi:deoxyribonuclease V